MADILKNFKQTKTAWGLAVSLMATPFFITISTAMAIIGYGLIGSFLEDKAVDALVIIIFPLGLILAVLGGTKFLLTKQNQTLKGFLSLRLPKKNAFWLVPVAVISYIVVLIVALSILMALNPEAAKQEQDVALAVEKMGGWKLIASVIGVGLLTPIGEELFFRGLLIRMYAKRLNKYWAVGISSFLFALAHAQLNVGIDTFIFGAFLGFVTIKTESIYPAIGMHMLKNGLALAFIIT